ncbi:MAG: aminotransferase class I/II-fold pyridoxal phosphate-dependent enzyme [Bryobacteraceae bacterium]|nr:aminotransferase class I/II-fold pyridoxal phosphate-dependent enzyme [Bryobacteraceae bacterium]
MRLEPFELERDQCVHEHSVEFNLSESGVHPLELADLLDPASLAGLRLSYGQANGSVELRERIAGLYPGATPDHILVTHGTAEANFLAVWNLIEPGDEIVYMVPNYLQIQGIARAFGAVVRPLPLLAENGWQPDLDALDRALSPRTRLIAVCNPNNPTGAVMSGEAMRRIAAAAARTGAWLLSDEIYRGAERDGVTTPSFRELGYERTLITAGLSKAYGAPGLRVGWIAGPPDRITAICGHHDYTTIMISTLSDVLAVRVLDKREQILERTRAILKANWPILRRWADDQPWLRMPDSRAGAIGFGRFHAPGLGSRELGDRLRSEKGVLIVPGSFFGVESHIRLNYGAPASYLEAGLARVSEFFRTSLVRPSRVPG